MQVPARASVTGGGNPPPAVMQRLRDSGLLLGAGGQDMVLGLEGINTLTAMGALGLQEPQPVNSWNNLWQSLIGGWSATGQQVVLNQNQAKIAETTPYGSVMYQPTAAAPGTPVMTPTGQVVQAGQNVANTLLLVAGAVVIVMLMQRN